jgi:transposase InsO family protein
LAAAREKDPSNRFLIFVASHQVAQNFTTDDPDSRWGADISNVWTAEGGLYLAVVLDLISHRVVGWATNDRFKRDLAVEAVDPQSAWVVERTN